MSSVIAAAWLIGPAYGQASAPRPLSIADVMSMRSLTPLAPVSLSGDGEWVAYTLTNPRARHTHSTQAVEFLPSGVPIEAEGTELWVMNVKTGSTRNLTGPIGASWDGVWSPDGRRLAFYSDRAGKAQIWVWDRTTDRTRRLSPLIAHPFFPFQAPQWTPDGKNLVVRILPEGQPLETTPDSELATGVRTPNDSLPTVTVYGGEVGHGDTSTAPVTVRQRNVVDLALMSARDGHVRRLVRKTPIMRYFLSPTGEDVAYTVPLGTLVPPEMTAAYDVRIVHVANSEARTVAKGIPQFWGPPISWSPDGAHIAFTSKRHSFDLYNKPDYALPAGDCYVVDLAADSGRNVTPGKHADFGTDFAAPVWDSTGTTLYITADDTLWRIDARQGGSASVASLAGKALVALVTSGSQGRAWQPDGPGRLFSYTLDTKTLRAGIARIDIAGRKDTLLFEDDVALPTTGRIAFDDAAARDVMVYVQETASNPEDLWTTGPRFDDRRRLTRINPQLDAYAFGTTRLVHWLGSDGNSLQGALLLPVSYQAGKRYPLITFVYGGEQWSMFANNFGLIPTLVGPMQLFATRGIAVFVPDIPEHVGTPMLDVGKAVLPGVNKIIELGIADPNRIAVMGHSYGCTTTLMLIVQTTRFKAAECSSGISSIPDAIGTAGGFGLAWATAGQGRMGASLWERRDRYIENSPLFYLDRVTTPLLLVQGTADAAVPPFQSDATYWALRSLGKRVSYLRYDGEDHVPMNYSAANRAHFLHHMVDWFEYYLFPTDQADPVGTHTTPVAPAHD